MKPLWKILLIICVIASGGGFYWWKSRPTPKTPEAAEGKAAKVESKGAGKRAVLYELLTRATTEQMTSDRRRQHDAYQASPPHKG